VALIKMFKKACVNRAPTVTEVDLMYRHIEGYAGPTATKESLKKMLPTLPDHMTWRMSGNKTLTDTTQISGVKFDTDKEQDGFFKWLAEQPDGGCFETFLRYQRTYHRIYLAQKKAEEEAEAGMATATATATAAGTPVKTGPGVAAASNVSPDKPDDLGDLDSSSSDDDSVSELFLSAMLQSKKRKARKAKAKAKAAKKAKGGKTDKSGK